VPEPAAPEPDDAPVPVEELPEPITVPKRTPIVGFLVRRMALATVLLAVGALGYGHATGQFVLPWLNDLMGDGTVLHLARNADAQQAMVIDSSIITPDESRGIGKGVWRTHTEAAGRDGAEPITVLDIDVEVPERHLAMTMSVRHQPPGSAMSHLFEIRFLRPDLQPDVDIANLMSLYMTAADGSRRAPLFGRVERVAPGLFFYGLAGPENERVQNLRNFKELPWLAVPLTYRNGVAGIVLIEKGAFGEKLVNDVLAEWAK
jgi:hypothetical protein